MQFNSFVHMHILAFSSNKSKDEELKLAQEVMKHLPEKYSSLTNIHKCDYLGYLIRNEETLVQYFEFIYDKLVELIDINNKYELEPQLLVPLAWFYNHIKLLNSNYQIQLFNISKLLFKKTNNFLINNCCKSGLTGTRLSKYNDLIELSKHLILSTVKLNREKEGKVFDLQFGDSRQLNGLIVDLNKMNLNNLTINYQLLLSLNNNIIVSNEYLEDYLMIILNHVFNYMEMNGNNKHRNVKSDLFVFHLLELFQYFDVTMLDEFKSKRQRYENLLKQFYQDVILNIESDQRYLSNLINYIHILICLNMVDMGAFGDFKDKLDQIEEMVSR